MMRSISANLITRFRRSLPVWVPYGLLAFLADCAAAAVGLAVGAALLVGTWIGVIKVNFPLGSTANQLSGNKGDVKLSILQDALGNTQLSNFSGILPGFTDLGVTKGNVDLNSGQVTGKVVEPTGQQHNLSDILPGLKATKNKASRLASETSNLSFALQFIQDTTVYTYTMTFEVEADDTGSHLTGNVTVTRQTTQNGQEVLNETGDGTVEADHATGSAADQPLPDPPAPLRVVAGPGETINLGDSFVIQASVAGGLGGLTYSWAPQDNLSDPQSLTPSVSPQKSTTYVVTVRDSSGQEATDSIRITVIGPDGKEITGEGGGGGNGGATPITAGLYEGTIDCHLKIHVPGSDTIEQDMPGITFGWTFDADGWPTVPDCVQPLQCARLTQGYTGDIEGIGDLFEVQSITETADGVAVEWKDTQTDYTFVFIWNFHVQDPTTLGMTWDTSFSISGVPAGFCDNCIERTCQGTLTLQPTPGGG